jgi:gluconokinase
MTNAAARVRLREAVEPYVLAIDIGSTASRGDVFDASGRPLKGGRVKVPHHFTSQLDGTSEIDPDAVVAEVEQIITAFANHPVAERIGAVALDTFASSLVGVGEDRKAKTPCFTYADSRCAQQVLRLRSELDELEVQQRTGCRLHTSYLAPRLRWLHETAPETFAAVRHWMSLGEYVYLRLLGVTAAGTSTAAWTGLLDRRTGDWDVELLNACQISPNLLSEICDPDRPIRDVAAAVGRRWPALAGALWFPVVADGFSSNVGVGAVDESTMAVAAATSGAMRVLVTGVPDNLPAGLWCYRVDASRSLLGGAVNDVGRAVSWLASTVQIAPELNLDDLLLAPPELGIPLVLPFFTGERSTGWAAEARAVFSGVSAGTTGAMLFRGTMESIALSYARIAAQLHDVAGETKQILASGRVTQDVPALLQVMADVLQTPVIPIMMKRTTLRGTALIALEVLAPGVVRAEPTSGDVRSPIEDRAPYYTARQQLFHDLYDAVIAAPTGAARRAASKPRRAPSKQRRK